MKKKNKKIFVGALATLLILGGASAVVGVASDGFKNWDTSTWFDGTWRAIEIEDQTKDWTGTRIDPDIVLPEGFTYEITHIQKDGVNVDLETGAIESGDYVFTLEVTNSETGEVREFFVNLTISADNQLPTKVEAKNIKIRTLKVEALSTGEIVKTIS